MKYRDTIKLNTQETTLAEADSIIEHLQGLGYAALKDGTITFEIDTEVLTDTPDDLWSLRDLLAEIEIELGSRGIQYTAVREKVSS